MSSRTYPARLPVNREAGAGRAAVADNSRPASKLAASFGRVVFIPSVGPGPYPLGRFQARTPLPYRKGGGRRQGLVAVLIRHLELERIIARLQRLEREQFRNGYLLSRSAGYRSHIFGIVEHRLLDSLFGDLVLDGAAGLLVLFVRRKVVKLGINAELFLPRKAVTQARTHLGVADHELTAADAVGRNFLDDVGQDQAALSQLVFFKMGDVEGHRIAGHIAADDVLTDDVQTVHAGGQRDGLLINLSSVQNLIQHIRRNLDGGRIFEGIDDAAGDG